MDEAKCKNCFHLKIKHIDIYDYSGVHCEELCDDSSDGFCRCKKFIP